MDFSMIAMPNAGAFGRVHVLGANFRTTLISSRPKADIPGHDDCPCSAPQNSSSPGQPGDHAVSDSKRRNPI
jgi:hypothetical protein